MNKEDVGKVYDTLLSIPGMNEIVKLDLKVNRKTVLLLSQVVSRGLKSKVADQDYGLPDVIEKGTIQELEQAVSECLQKAGLVELSDKLTALQSK